MQKVQLEEGLGAAQVETTEELAAERRRTRRRLRRARRLGALVLLITPVLLVVTQDAWRRGDRLLKLEAAHRLTYSAAILESLVVWGVLLYAASRRRGALRWVAATLFVIGCTFAFGGQQYFFQQYNAYLNVDVSVFASNFMDSVANQLFADIGNYLWAKLPPFLIAIGLVVLARRLVRPRARPALIAACVAPLLLVASFFIPTQHRHVQAPTPDVLYLNAVGGLIRTQLGLTDQSNQIRPRARESLPVATLTPKGDKPPNVLVVLLESVRADATCIVPEKDCRRTPYTDRLVPNRFPLTQMRAMASCTAISLAVLWSGLGPHEDRETLHTWPLLYDYSRAAGYDTAYWTSQNMMFGNARLWVQNLGVSQFVSATDLEPTADLDIGAPEHLLADHVVANIDGLKEPFFATVHLSNVHYPYLVDPNLPMPFQPATTSKAPDQNGSFFRHYLNAVHQQDMQVARIIEHVQKSAYGERTVIVYTSDHAEAFREHGQMGHTFSVFDEEIHVPAWISAPKGTLTPEQEQNLKNKQDDFTFHVDVTPTILDVMGVYDDPAISKYKERMLGTSLLRPESTTRPLPMTNCAAVWSCAFENWGIMQRNMKLEARAWDPGWKCFDLADDPYEKNDLGPAGCGDLVDHALKTFGRLPGRKQ